MGMFSSNSVAFFWKCPNEHINKYLISRDEDPVSANDSSIITCKNCDKQIVATVRVDISYTVPVTRACTTCGSMTYCVHRVRMHG
jgi:hypothetical protein